MNRSVFYSGVRTSLFGGNLNDSQVQGMENLINVWDKYFPKDSDFLLAYNLGTAFHETAKTMQPITERGPVSYFNKYEPGTPLGKMLGNTVKGDGYRFRGEGHVQNTGRRNAAVATKRINELFGLGIDLVKNPEKRGDPFISAISLFLGNKEGWWTGKDLLDYIDGVNESEAEDLREFTEARRVVNGTDKASIIAGYAMRFYKAIETARGAAKIEAANAAPVQKLPTPIDAPPAPAPEKPTLISTLISILAKLFAGRAA